MLYPKEDRLNNTLMFSCRTCQFSEPAPSSCVYRNTLYNTVGETAGVTQDVGSDPTVGQPAAAAVREPDGEEYFDEECAPFCTLCGNEIMCAVCGVEPCGGFEHTTHAAPVEAAAAVATSEKRHQQHLRDERDEEEEREMEERRISL